MMLTAESSPIDLTIPAFGGLTLRAWHWARPEPRAALIVAHGFGEHGGRYRALAELLGPALEIDIVAPDFRGHGRSPGRRGVVELYADLTADLRAAFDWVGRAHPGLPRFVLGHSNGGQVALHLALDREAALAGLILSNPALRVARKVPRHVVLLGKFLRRYAPGVTLTGKVPAEHLTRDPAMQELHRNDPLLHSRISAPLYFGMIEGGPFIDEHAGEIRAPILMILGGADPLIDPLVSSALFERLGSPDKTLTVYPEMLHEPLNEIGREKVIADITDWLDRHITREPGEGDPLRPGRTGVRAGGGSAGASPAR